MQSIHRRVFILQVATGTAALAATGLARAQAAAPADAVKETDPYPKSMGFRVNTATVDKVKFPRHEASQKCSECQLYSVAKAGDVTGTCSFFKRTVPQDGWCRNFKPKKAA